MTSDFFEALEKLVEDAIENGTSIEVIHYELSVAALALQASALTED